jgi:hypothetical protein
MRRTGFGPKDFTVIASSSRREKIRRSGALRRVRENIENQVDWLDAGLAALELEAEEVSVAPMYKLVKPDNRGHTFY